MRKAGPTGCAWHRQLTALGIECGVVAPSLIPARPGNRVKTNRRDAVKLGRLRRIGDPMPAGISDQAGGALRNLVRARDAAKRTNDEPATGCPGSRCVGRSTPLTNRYSMAPREHRTAAQGRR
jgi:hypothetical protein